MPFPFAPLATALGSGLNFMIGQSNTQAMQQTARENTDKTIAANKASAELAYQRDMAQWERSNKYNDPSSQMARLKAAGLNPMLAYGSGNVAGMSSGASPSMGTPQQDYNYQAQQTPSLDLQSLGQGYQDFRLQNAQIQNVEANTAATQQRTANEVIQGTLLAIEKYYQPQERETRLRGESIKNRYLEPQILLDMLLKNSQNALLEQDFTQKSEMFPHDLDLKKGAVKQQAETTKEIMSRIKLQGYQGLQTKAQTANIEQSTRVGEADVKLKNLQLLLNNQDLLEKEYNNFLRSRGTAPDDNPLKAGTRNFMQFMEWLLDYRDVKSYNESLGEIKNPFKK